MFRRLRYYLEMRGARGAQGAPMPSERTWVHPSELPGSFDNAVLPAVRTPGTRRFQVTVASTATALLATGALLLAVPAGTQPAGATDGPHVATSVASLPAPVRAAADATLALVIYEHQHIGTANAMIVPPGDLAVTTTPIAPGASIMGLRPGSAPMALSVVGTDRLLGVTVLRLPSTMPVTPTGPLSPAVAPGGSPTTLTALAAVRGATTPVEFQYAAAYMAATPTAVRIGSSTIAVTRGVSLVGVVAGSLVLDGQGRAVAASVPALGQHSFVPATFLQLLAQRMVLGDEGGHGWLQVAGVANVAGPPRIASVTPHGAAWPGVHAGDILVAIDSQPVRTMADVGSLLYTTSPGQSMDLTLLRHGHLHDVVVRLAASP